MREEYTNGLRTNRITAQTADAHATSITREQIANVADLFAMYPQMGPIAISLGLAGVPPNSSLAVQAGVQSARKQAQMLPNPGKVVTGGMLKSFFRDLGADFNMAVDATGPIGQIAKDTVRQQFTAASYPIEMVKAFGNTATGAWMEGWNGWGGNFDFGATNDYLKEHGSLGDLNERTTLGAGIAEMVDVGLLSDEAGDVFGDGFFVGDDTAARQRQVAEAREVGLIDGHAITLGRGVASSVLEPGSLAYNLASGTIDAATYIADPTAAGGNALRSAQIARRVVGAGRTKEFTVADDVAAAAGLVEGNRQVVLPEKFGAWLGSEQGGKVAQAYADTTDFNTLMRMTNWKLPLHNAIELLDATDTPTVKAALIKATQEGAARGEMTAKVGKPAPRLFTNMPGAGIRRSDPDQAILFLDRFQKIAGHLLGEETISKNNEAVARALLQPNDPQQTYNAFKAVDKTIADALVSHGVPEAMARQVLRKFGQESETLHSYARDDIGRALEFPGVARDPEGRALSTPHLLSEALGDFIPLPDPRAFKTVARRLELLRKMEQNGITKGVKEGADWVTQDLFKTMVLATRPAWALRVVGEETFGRMTAASLASPISHPISYFSIVEAIKPNTKLSAAIRATGIKGRMGNDVLGRQIMEHAVEEGYQTNFGKALNKASGGWVDDITKSLSGKHIDVDKLTASGTVDPMFPTAWHHELKKLHADPMTRWMAAGAPLENVQKAFWGGRMAHFREMLVNSGNTAVATRAGSDEFIRTEFVRLMKATDGDNELLAAVAKNSLGGHAMTDGVKINPAVTRALKEIVEADPSRGPAYLSGPITGTLAHVARAKSNAAVQHLFHIFGTMPTNRFSRSVTHQQYYWRRIEELGPMMTVKARKLALRNAEKTRLPKKRIEQMRKDFAASPPGELTLRDADWAAGRYALGEVKTLLYDLHERGQWADAIRVLGPFAEAMKEVALTWARLVKNRPAIPYRVMQGVDKLDDDGSGVIYDLTGTPHPQEPGNRGFFFTDQFGEERFAYPGSQLLSGLAGDPGGFSTPVQGLNMFGTMAIGAGPVVSIPFAKAAPKGEDWEWIRGQILPYGDTDTGSGALEAFLPAYMRKLQVAFDVHPSAAQQRAFANQAHTIATYLLSTGDYDVSTDEGKDKLLQDAQHKARTMFLIRGIAQSTLPSAPSPQMMALDKDGHLTMQYVMAQDYDRMRDDPDIGPSGVDQAFIEKWGADALGATVKNTRSEGASPTSKEAYRLRQAHPEVARRYPLVFGLFAPDPDEFFTAESVAQIDAGKRQVNTPDDVLNMVNRKAAAAIYNTAREKLPKKLNPNQSALLAQLKSALEKEYPGYSGEFGGSPNHARVLELERAATNKTLATTDAGKGLTKYLEIRAAAAKLATDQHLGDWTSTKRAARIRDLVRQGAAAIIEENPDFATMWERVLSRELVKEK